MERFAFGWTDKVRSLSWPPAEEIDETRFKTVSLNFLVALCMQIKKRFPLEKGGFASLEILDSVAAQDLSKHPSSIVNVALHFFHLVAEDELEAISIL